MLFPGYGERDGTFRMQKEVIINDSSALKWSIENANECLKVKIPPWFYEEE